MAFSDQDQLGFCRQADELRAKSDFFLAFLSEPPYHIRGRFAIWEPVFTRTNLLQSR
jgi:hypothetical protein